MHVTNKLYFVLRWSRKSRILVISYCQACLCFHSRHEYSWKFNVSGPTQCVPGLPGPQGHVPVNTHTHTHPHTHTHTHTRYHHYQNNNKKNWTLGALRVWTTNQFFLAHVFVYFMYSWLQTHQKRASDPITDVLILQVVAGNWTQNLWKIISQCS